MQVIVTVNVTIVRPDGSHVEASVQERKAVGDNPGFVRLETIPVINIADVRALDAIVAALGNPHQRGFEK